MNENLFYDAYKHLDVSWDFDVAAIKVASNWEKKIQEQLKNQLLYGSFTNAVIGVGVMFNKGDRVEVRQGYLNAGEVGFYVGKDPQRDGYAFVEFFCTECYDACADVVSVSEKSFTLKPYTREERIERAIEDLEGLVETTLPPNTKAALFAIIEKEAY